MSEETQIEKRAPDLFVLAKNPQEMVTAQNRLIDFFEAKLKQEQERKKDLETNLEVAKKNKWRTDTLRRHVGYAQNRVEFYEKIRDALKAGYNIIPDIEMDVFAIRTSAKKPRENRVTAEVTSWRDGQMPHGPKSNEPPAGEGEYVAPDRIETDQSRFVETPKKEGEKPKEMVTRWATGFCEIEFPFQLARTEVMELTAEALKQKIFDEVGVLPRKPGRDPMVIGRIKLKGSPSWNPKTVSFVVAWFLDLKEFE